MRSTSTGRGVLFAVGSVVCFATIGSLAKAAIHAGGTVPAILGVRFAAAALLWSGALWRDRAALREHRRAVVRLGLAGIVGALLSSYTEVDAYHYLPVGVVVVILFVNPVWLAVIERTVFRRPIGSAAVLGLGLVVVGLVLLVDPAVRVSWSGLLLAFGSSVTAVFLFLGMDEALDALRPTTAAGVVVAAAALVAVPVGLISGGTAVVARHPSVIGWSILLGLIASGIGLGLLAVGVGSLGALRAAVIAATEPVVAAAMAWVFLGETLRAVQVVGGLIVIGGTVAVARSRARPIDRYAVQPMDVDAGFPPIVTERLLLRRSGPADAETISAYRSDPEVHRYQGWDRLDVEGIREQIEEMAARRPGDPGWIQLSMELLDTGELIGDVGLSPAEGEPGVIKVGYTVAPAFQGRGYATEAVRALVGYAFGALGATIVRAYADADNVASHRVAERVGMTLVERIEHRDGEHVWRGVRYEVRL